VALATQLATVVLQALQQLPKFISRDADKFASPGAFTLNNKDSWSELTLATSFIWDGSSNIEVSLFHGTDGPSTYSYTTGLKTKYDSSATPSKRGRYQTTSSTTISPRTWTNAAAVTTSTGTNPIKTYGSSAVSYQIPQIEFVTAGCTSQDLDVADCEDMSGCSQCIARADCAFLTSSYGTTACKSQSYAASTSYTETTVCPRACSSYQKCYECRNETRDHKCYWVQ
jgi:hypothetical protein